MSNLTLPPPREPPIDPRTGVFSRNWIIYFQQVFNRIGGSGADTITDISQQLADQAVELAFADPVEETAPGETEPNVDVLSEIAELKKTVSDQRQEIDLSAYRQESPKDDFYPTSEQFNDVAELRKAVVEARNEIALLHEERAHRAELRKQLDDLSVSLALVNDTPLSVTSGTFTPAITFATPGDLAVTYSSQLGVWTRIGRLTHVSIIIQTSAFTFTTASGNLQITGNPFTSEVSSRGTCEWAGITKASYTQVVSRLLGASGSATATFNLGASGSGQPIANITAADMPTGGSVRINITHTFLATQ